jgi:hypothetical protein
MQHDRFAREILAISPIMCGALAAADARALARVVRVSAYALFDRPPRQYGWINACHDSF